MKISRINPEKAWDEQDIPKREGKTVCVSRYGAFGDMLQMSSVLPGLKEQGYTVCVNTEPSGLEIVRNDPHIDEFLIQEKNQIPNADLWKFWALLSSKFEKFVILSESVEGSLLALPGRRAYRWPQEFRRMVMNVNYMEATHAIAGVPFNPAPKFYPSKQEKGWAVKYRAKLGLKNTVIMWSIAGSSVHKVYPHIDMVIARVLHEHENVRFILVGDELSSIIEYDWRNEKRVIRKCGKWSIRESLSMAQQCDMVIGPETGVMNAVSFEAMPKVLMLSHSSKDNIGKHWVNTHQLIPDGVDCYPCHKLHYGFATCNRDEETGTAKCAAATDPEKIIEIIKDLLRDKR